VYRSLIVLVAFLIAGCATHSPEADAQGQAQAEADAASKDSTKCQSYGLQPGDEGVRKMPEATCRQARASGSK
jgi:hypothetical protein